MSNSNPKAIGAAVQSAEDTNDTQAVGYCSECRTADPKLQADRRSAGALNDNRDPGDETSAE